MSRSSPGKQVANPIQPFVSLAEPAAELADPVQPPPASDRAGPAVSNLDGAFETNREEADPGSTLGVLGSSSQRQGRDGLRLSPVAGQTGVNA